jgi:NADPH:quinone reductase-like Zn-dependent oxidoreductase
VSRAANPVRRLGRGGGAHNDFVIIQGGRPTGTSNSWQVQRSARRNPCRAGRGADGLFGCTFQEDEVFEDLIAHVERDEVRPVVARTYALEAIASAQEAFLTKGHVGKLALIPPGPAP